MPPKQRITRDMILDQSFAMFEREGMDAVNARSIAKALNCSTQPIFSYFSGMEDLKKALDQRAWDSFEESVACKGAGKPSVQSVCNAYVRFAGEQPRLFLHLFMRNGSALQGVMLSEELRQSVAEQESAASELSVTQARQLCNALWVHAHGLAAARAAGLFKITDKSVAEWLDKFREGEVLRLKGETEGVA